MRHEFVACLARCLTCVSLPTTDLKMGLYCSGTALSMAASLATVLPELSLPCRYKRDM